MCGIACVIGKDAALECFNSLKKLEYRGYDSAGIAYLDGDKIRLEKRVGEVNNLKSFALSCSSNFAIGHTRWATHGAPSIVNCHPHMSFDNSLAIVHNGIIENYLKLKDELIKKNISFKSETDSEVIASYIAASNGSMLEKIENFMQKAEGSYACCILTTSGDIYAFKKGCPLYFADGDHGKMFASDIVCFISRATSYYAMCDGEIIHVKETTTLLDKNFNQKQMQFSKLLGEKEDISKLGYSHFMQKEIMQASELINKINSYYTKDKLLTAANELQKASEIILVGCGTAYHACRMGALFLEEKFKKPCRTFVASELLYQDLAPTNAVCIFLSQSGETADTLKAMQKFKQMNKKTIAITNCIYSSLAIECDICLPVLAGVEVAVASTKAYIGQLYVLYKLANAFEIEEQFSLSESDVKNLTTLNDELVHAVESANHVFFIGRGIDSITSLEAALKLKEITYIPSEGYPAGELKHGTLALIEKGSIVFVFATQEKLSKKTLSNLKEVKTRGATTILVACEDYSVSADYKIILPKTKDERLRSITAIIPMQELAYKVSVLKGYDPDKPRNLAKSVTVE